MRVERGLAIVLGLTATAACAAGGAGGPQTSAASLPQVMCDTAAPAATEFARAAADALNRALVVNEAARGELYTTALTQSQQGIAADAANPYHYYFAGQTYLRLDSLSRADQMLDRTVEVCPGFAAEVATVRREAWAEQLQAGVDAINAADTATAIAAWTRANEIFAEEPNAQFNLALVYTRLNDPVRAGAAAREALAILRRMPADTAAETMAERRDMRATATEILFNEGVSYFQAEDYRKAAELFRAITEMDPGYRDAWTNYTFALYKLEDWPATITASERLLQLAPLNDNAMLVLAEAYRGAERLEEGLRMRERNRDAQVYVDQLRLNVDGTRATAQGVVVGNAAQTGSPVRLLVTFTDEQGEVGQATVTVTAPARGEQAPFEAAVETTRRPTSFRYQLQP